MSVQELRKNLKIGNADDFQASQAFKYQCRAPIGVLRLTTSINSGPIFLEFQGGVGFFVTYINCRKDFEVAVMPPKSSKSTSASQRESTTMSSDEESSTVETSEEDEPKARSKAPKKARSRTANSSQGTKSSQGTSGSQVELPPALSARLTSDMVKFLLIANQKKQTIKRADISKNVMREYFRQYNTVFGKAKEKLLQVFGLEVKELEKKKGHYILVNSINVDSEDNHLSWPKEENSRYGLLAVILTIIYMNGNNVSEKELWAALKKVGIEKEGFHDEFGDVNKIITKEFVRNMYLEYIKVPDSEPPVYEFEWGQRAILEVEKKDLLDFVCQIYGNVKPQDWVSQYQEAYPAT